MQISEVDLSMTNDNFQEQHKMNEVNLNENTRNDSEENGADEETEGTFQDTYLIIFKMFNKCLLLILLN